MTSLLANLDFDKPHNFWKINPSWKTPKVFNDLYTSDKSKDKNQSSLIMWGVVLMFEKSTENPWRNMDSEERIELINEDVMNDSRFDWSKYKPVIDYAQKLLMTEEERNLMVLEQYIEKRRRFLEEQQDDLNFDTMKQLDDSIKRNADIAKELDRLRIAVGSQEEEILGKGGKKESLSEQGLI